jgi:hypothetical protein
MRAGAWATRGVLIIFAESNGYKIPSLDILAMKRFFPARGTPGQHRNQVSRAAML